MLSIFDLACNDAIVNKDNSWLLELKAIANGKYDKEDIEIKNLDEVAMLMRNGITVWYKNSQCNEVFEVDKLFTSLIQEHLYKISVMRNVERGFIKFVRQPI